MSIGDEPQHTQQAPSGAACVWFNAWPGRFGSRSCPCRSRRSLFQARAVSAIDMALLTELSLQACTPLQREERRTRDNNAAHMGCPTVGPGQPGWPHDPPVLGEYPGTPAVEQCMKGTRPFMDNSHRACPVILAGLLPWLPGGFARAALPGQTKTLVDGNTAFACDLYAQLRKSPGNLFFSPYSVSTALAMTYAGARGDTEA